MKRKFGLLIGVCTIVFLMNYSYAKTAHPNHCSTDAPKLIQKIKNYQIIATETGEISTSQAFSGKDLHFSFSAHPKNKKNRVSVNHKTGKIKVIAEHADNFDVKIIAKNACGSVSTIFNVEIAEEH